MLLLKKIPVRHNVRLNPVGLRARSSRGNGQPNVPTHNLPSSMNSQENLLLRIDHSLKELFQHQVRIQHEAEKKVDADSDFLNTLQSQHMGIINYMRQKDKQFFEKIESMEQAYRELHETAILEASRRKKWDATFNVRGALERIIKRAKDQPKFEIGKAVKTQKAINKLLEAEEVKTLLDMEVAARRLDPGEVKFCLQRIYHHLSIDAHGHDDMIVISSLYHGNNERAGLVALLKAQEGWPQPMAWREE